VLSARHPCAIRGPRGSPALGKNLECIFERGRPGSGPDRPRRPTLRVNQCNRRAECEGWRRSVSAGKVPRVSRLAQRVATPNPDTFSIRPQCAPPRGRFSGRCSPLRARTLAGRLPISPLAGPYGRVSSTSTAVRGGFLLAVWYWPVSRSWPFPDRNSRSGPF